MSLWTFYKELVFDLDPVLSTMCNNGVSVNTAAQDKLREKIAAELEALKAEAQEAVPYCLCPTKLHKKRPVSGLITETMIPGKVKVCLQCGLEFTSKTKHQKGRGNPCKKALVEVRVGTVVAFVETLLFNPLSGQQLMLYCDHFGHPLGRHMKTGMPTVDKKHLVKLEAKYGIKHPIYRISARMRVINKVLSTFVDGFKPDAAGKIHGTYKHTPSTFRLAQANVNLMQVSHREGAVYAAEVRETIVPSPECCFVEADSSAIEAVFTGYFAGDLDYIKLAQRGVHAYLCCLELGWDFTPENAAKVKANYPALYAMKKQIVHGSSYGMGPALLASNYPHIFKSRSQAKAEQEKFFTACPIVPQWWRRIKEFAYKNGFLENPWGLKMYFFQTLRRHPDDPSKLIDGEDADASVAALPQSSAGCFGRESLKLYAADGWLPYMPAIGFNHDSYTLDVPLSLKDRAIAAHERILTRPIPQMGGLRVGCEIKVGLTSWASVKTVKMVSVAA